MSKKITIVMKSGCSFSFVCEEAEITSVGNELTGYSFKGLSGASPWFIRINDIDAIIETAAPEDEEGEE